MDDLFTDGTGNIYTYNADGMITASGGATYTYDGLNQRVEKTGGSNPTETIYFGGVAIALLNASSGAWTDLIYAGSSMIAEVAGTQTALPTYRHQDHLGSLVLQTNNSGTVTGSNVFLPFGDLVSSTTSDVFQYTGLPQDTENSSYHATYRNMSTTQSRWLSPDPYNGSYDLTNPQSFNRYVYAMNNPLNFIDSTGLDENGNNCDIFNPCNTANAGSGDPQCQLNADGNCQVNGGGPPDVGDPYIPYPTSTGPGNPPNPGGGSGPSNPRAPNNNKQQQHDCLNQYTNSAGGKAVQFLSLYNLATNLGSLKTWAEWTLVPALKTGAIAAVNSVSSTIGGTEFWSITSGASAPAATVSAPAASTISAVEPVAAVAAPVAIGAATVVDIQVHAACAGINTQAELAPTVF
jgi:RHS repeat-associated protein